MMGVRFPPPALIFDRTYTGYLERILTQELSKAAELRYFALNIMPVESCKRFVIRLNACCKWGMPFGVISESPFDGMAQEIKLTQFKKTDEEINIYPFTSS